MKKICAVFAVVFCLLLGGCAEQKHTQSNAAPAQGQTAASGETNSDSSAMQSAVSDVAESSENQAFFTEMKKYLLESTEIANWNGTFLERLDFDALYADYLTAGGTAGDKNAFAVYLGKNAPVLSDWKELFEESLQSLSFANGGVDRYEPLGDDFYQVYVLIDGESKPYVTVNARTGWFHG